MSLSFFADTHIAKQVAIQLRTGKIEIVRCQEVGMEDASDDELLDYAITHEHAMLTKDDDFLTLHNQLQTVGRQHFGIFYCPYRDKPAIGLIVATCREYHLLVESDVGSDEDIQNDVT